MQVYVRQGIWNYVCPDMTVPVFYNNGNYSEQDATGSKQWEWL